ncbi:MAG: ATP-binding protein [Ardenticatenaceae bacterium]
MLVGLLRLPIYIAESFWALWLQRHKTPLEALSGSPVIWDELLLLPQPYLGSLLAQVMAQDTKLGLHYTAKISLNPHQRWAVGKALPRVWRTEPERLFHTLGSLLHQPPPYIGVGVSRKEREREQDRYFTVKLILGEVCGLSPIEERLTSFLTAGWRESKKDDPTIRITEVYYRLLMEEPWHAEYLGAFEPFREGQHGEESYQTFFTLNEFLEYRKIKDLPDAIADSAWVEKIAEPWRPQVLAFLRDLAEVGREVQTYQRVSSGIAKRDALARAYFALRRIKDEAATLAPPENRLIVRVAVHWAELIAAEQVIVAQPKKILRIENNYIVGPTLRPENGRLFAGRDDVFQEINHLWSNTHRKHSLIIHGERRMGKSSILLHLRHQLGDAYVPVFLNMQTHATVSDFGTFLYNLASTIYREINRTLDLADDWTTKPQLERYQQDTFVPFRHFMQEADDAMGQTHWLILMVDEFEMIEQKIKEDIFPADLLFHFRDTMTFSKRTTFVFAGCHTLDEMTKRYWNPFFGITQNIKVSYLTPQAAATLITNPWDNFDLQYEAQAVEAIIRATGGQAMLLQDTCQTVIQRINKQLRETGAQLLPTATLDDAQSALERVLNQSNYFNGVWADPHLLTPHERITLAALAQRQTAPHAKVPRAEVDPLLTPYLTDQQINQAWQLLHKRDMVDVDGNQHRFTVQLVWQWVRKFQPLEKVAKEEMG